MAVADECQQTYGRKSWHNKSRGARCTHKTSNKIFKLGHYPENWSTCVWKMLVYPTGEWKMLVKFTIEGGLIPVTRQAREPQFRQFLDDLHDYDSDAEPLARSAVQCYLDDHREFTAADRVRRRVG